MSDRAPTVDRALSSRYFPKALDLLTSGLKISDVETLILTPDANVRKEFGSAVSSIMLENGLRLLSRSNKIKSDCIVNIWVVGEERDEPDHVLVLQTIGARLKEVDFISLAPPFCQCLPISQRWCSQKTIP